MPCFSVEKAFRSSSIWSACPHHLSNCNPHLMPSLCNQLRNRDAKISALTWTMQGRYFACFSSPTISQGSKTLPHLITVNIKAAPTVHNWCCPSQRGAGHWARWRCCFFFFLFCLAEHGCIYCTSKHLNQTTYLFGTRRCARTGRPCAALPFDRPPPTSFTLLPLTTISR